MDTEVSTTTESTVKKRGRKPGKRGRPKGSATQGVKKRRGRKRGRPKASANNQKPGITRRGRKRGTRSKQSVGTNQQLTNGIHLIGQLLVIDVNQLGCEEVIFVGGKSPKIR